MITFKTIKPTSDDWVHIHKCLEDIPHDLHRGFMKNYEAKYLQSRHDANVWLSAKLECDYIKRLKAVEVQAMPKKSKLPAEVATQGDLNRGYSNTPCYDPAQNITIIDWVRVTSTSLEDVKYTLSELDGEHGLLTTAGIDIKWSDKGLNGYTESAKLKVWKGSESLTVGNIALSKEGSNAGGMVELSGVGCKIFQLEYPELWNELFELFVQYEWRITRTDIALDLNGRYCHERAYTVPSLLKKATEYGLFMSDRQRNPNMKQTFSTAGDWTPLITGVTSPESYDPRFECESGLTAYIGNRKGSDDFFRIYEKGKEVKGKSPVSKDKRLDGKTGVAKNKELIKNASVVDSGWVRIEHEMSRKGSGRVIPLEVMINPDKYFCVGRSKARALMDELRAYYKMNKVDEWHKERFKTEKSLLLSKKLNWAKHSYGRVIKTLKDEGWTDAEIVAKLSRSNGLKEFVFDLIDPLIYDPATGEWIPDKKAVGLLAFFGFVWAKYYSECLEVAA